MRRVYLDNASTSFPKAPGCGGAVGEFIENSCFNVSRGGYGGAYDTERMVFDTRERIAALFNAPSPKCVAFTQNVTYALNLVLKGLLRKGDHVIVSSMEHNAVMRPLFQLQAQGVECSVAKANGEGELDANEVESLFRPNTVAVVMTGASNVCGTCLPTGEIGELCSAKGATFVLDSAQTAGVLPIDMKAQRIDGLCFTGHKGLLAPQGAGGLALTPELAERLTPIITGGTGSFSHLAEPVGHMPDKFEAGTPNLPAIAGLNFALRYLASDHGIYEREKALTARFLQLVSTLKNARILGKADAVGRVGIVALDFEGKDNAQISGALDDEYGIMTRCGLHCAPSAHKTLGTYPQGAVRFSFGYSTTTEELEYCAECLRELTGGT